MRILKLEWALQNNYMKLSDIITYKCFKLYNGKIIEKWFISACCLIGSPTFFWPFLAPCYYTLFQVHRSVVYGDQPKNSEMLSCMKAVPKATIQQDLDSSFYLKYMILIRQQQFALAASNQTKQYCKLPVETIQDAEDVQNHTIFFTVIFTLEDGISNTAA
ncbi:hypothetical protein ACJX0J_005779 [Zea mays]